MPNIRFFGVAISRIIEIIERVLVYNLLIKRLVLMNFQRMASELLWVFNVHYKEGNRVESHSHRYHYQLMYVKSGRCIYMSRNLKYILEPGSLSLLAPGEVHAIDCVTEALTTYELKFLFDDSALSKAMEFVPPVFHEDALIRELMFAIIEIAGNPQSNANKLAFSYYLGSLLCHITKSYQKNDVSYSSTVTPDTYLSDFDAYQLESYSEATKSAIDFVNANYHRSISLEDICKEINYNKSYLCFIFKRDTGKTVNDYLTYVRIKTAAQLIVSGTYTLSELSKMTGYKTVSHFSRIFKKTIGITPGLYKSAFLKDSIIADLVSMDISEESRAMLSKAVLVEMDR